MHRQDRARTLRDALVQGAQRVAVALEQHRVVVGLVDLGIGQDTRLALLLGIQRGQQRLRRRRVGEPGVVARQARPVGRGAPASVAATQ